METADGDASWINKNIERPNKSIHNMVIAGILESNQHANKFCCAAET